ncbi:sulfotransferase domain-containing protein [Fodinicurvata sediminis]|uniref:sulfotransferase domain-containing protein n=1 Tax=Fodinicurvata sediminis TaxID=1121832 RepID=UPI0003B73D7B|nr:sulfotransferase domain-containing protein [Fodinicurvata sediminis]
MGGKILKRQVRSLRHFFRPGGNYIISFPKCGRTWLRLMLGHYLAHHNGIESQDYLMTGELLRQPGVPQLVAYHDDKPYKRTPEELERSKTNYRKDRVLFLCRDPRDVLVSQYYSLRYRASSHGYDGPLQDYVYEARGSLATIVAYYNIWADQQHNPRDFLLLRYEDMIAEPATALTRALGFFGVREVRPDLVAQAVDYASFDNMRQLEEADAFGRKTLRPTEKGDLRTYKTRKGVVGDHLEALAPRELAHVNAVVARELDPFFGYGEVSAAVSEGSG